MILVAITHVGIRETLVQSLTDETRYVVVAVASGPDALEATRDCLPDLLILDYYLSPCEGLLSPTNYIPLRGSVGCPPSS